MKVYAVGTGCTWFTRNNTSFILDDNILFDTPNGSYKEIINQIDLLSVKGIFISHFHSDHYADMHIIATRFMREAKNHGLTEKLKVFGPKGMLDKLIDINMVFCSAPDELDRYNFLKVIDFIEVGDGDEFEFGGYKIKVYELDHGDVYSQGYTFTDNRGVTVGFTADTRDCENLRKMLACSNVAFVDMSAIEPAKAHLDTKAFVKIEKIYPNCKMYPIHTSDKTLEIAKQNGMNLIGDGETLII